MKRYAMGCIMLVLFVGGCSAGSPAGSGSGSGPRGGSVATSARSSTPAKAKNASPTEDDPYLETPADNATVLRMLRAQGFQNVHMDGGGRAVDFDTPACPKTMAGNLGGVRMKDKRLHLLITNNGIDFLDVDRPPTRQQLDEYGLCSLSDAA